jgi:GNAT superfamily N-acetyltransferase
MSTSGDLSKSRINRIARLLLATPVGSIVNSLEQKYPGLHLFVSENDRVIHVHEIKVPPAQQGKGIGSAALRAVQQYAQSVRKPIILSPEPEPRKKAKLHKFYKNLGFRPNKGRYKDYSLSSFFGTNWLWRPEVKKK